MPRYRVSIELEGIVSLEASNEETAEALAKDKVEQLIPSEFWSMFDMYVESVELDTGVDLDPEARARLALRRIGINISADELREVIAKIQKEQG